MDCCGRLAALPARLHEAEPATFLINVVYLRYSWEVLNPSKANVEILHKDYKV